MKSTVHPDGRVDLDGTPEELAAYARSLPVRVPFGATGPACTCQPGLPVRWWGIVCPVHPAGYAPFPQITAAGGRPPTTMTGAHPVFESAELGVPSNTARPVMWCRCGVFAVPHPSRTWDSADGTRHTPELCTATGMQG